MVNYILFFMLVGVSFIFYFLHMKRFSNVILETNPYTREYNKTESPIERRLFNALRFRDIPVVCQYPFDFYRLDMALPWLKICIECDGKYHLLPDRKIRDRKRDAYLRARGWKTLRFTGRQINGDINGVIRRIEQEIRKKAPLT